MQAVVKMKRLDQRTDPGAAQPSHPGGKGQNRSQEPKEKVIKGNKMVNGMKCFKVLQQKTLKNKQTNKQNQCTESKLSGRKGPRQSQSLPVLTQGTVSALQTA